MRLALAQLRAIRRDPAATIAVAADTCRQARAGGADIIVFPELWQTGYGPCPEAEPEREAWLAQAEPADGPYVTAFCRIAARHQLAVVTGFLRRAGTGPRNSAAVIDAAGAIVLLHDKVHLCDFTWEQHLEPGEGFDTAAVATRSGRIQLGVMTCFDREFPESARELTLAGAELVVVPNACLICDDTLGQLRSRAFENMIAVAMANYPLPDMNGRSCVFDGIAVEAGRPRDHQIFVADGRPGLHLVDLDLPRIRRYRAEGIWQSSRRRPAAYRRLAGNNLMPEGTR